MKDITTVRERLCLGKFTISLLREVYEKGKLEGKKEERKRLRSILK